MFIEKTNVILHTDEAFRMKVVDSDAVSDMWLSPTTATATTRLGNSSQFMSTLLVSLSSLSSTKITSINTTCITR